MTNFRHVKVTAKHIKHYRIKRRAKTLFDLIFQIVQYVSVTAAALIMAFNGNYGQYIIAGYGLLIILPKLWPFSYGPLEEAVENLGSSQVFTVALLILVSIPIFTLIGKDTIAQNAAIYVFELLVVGVIAATIELWRDKSAEVQEQPSGDPSNHHISLQQ